MIMVLVVQICIRMPRMFVHTMVIPVMGMICMVVVVVVTSGFVGESTSQQGKQHKL